MDEFSFIDAIKQKTYRQPGLIKGVGDDAAVFRQTTEEIVTAVDTFVEGTHFSKSTVDAYHLGYRALGVNLSDMAAMGATPRYYMVSIVCPKSFSSEGYELIFQGMEKLAYKYGMDLIGGDTVSGNELSISVTIIGSVPTGKVRYRHDSKPGDIVFVTGTLGDAQAGLHILMNQLKATDAIYFKKRHQLPEPRIEFAVNLRGIDRLALNDVSDGIASEANEIAEASKVGMELVANDLPVSPHYHQFPDHLQHKWMLYGGEDFELLGTVNDSDWETVKKAAECTNISVNQIGYVTSKKGVFLHEKGKRTPLYKDGYTHLK